MGDMESQMQSLMEGSNYDYYLHHEERENAFNARLEYEKNCILKYDRPNMPSRTPIKGERIEDYAHKFNTTVELMKEVLPSVENYLEDKGVGRQRTNNVL